MRAIVPLIVVLVAACTSSPQPDASGSPKPSASASSPSASSTTPATSPSPLDTGPGALGLHCRLPVVWTVQNGAVATAKAGFVTFPDLSVAEDAAAPPNSIFFDRAVSKWLRVDRSSVSPDGRHYAYTVLAGNAYQNTGSKVHVMDVVSGADRVIYDGKDAFTIVDFSAEGVYLSGAPPEGARRGLWLADLAGGSPRLISSTIIAPAIGNGAAWGLDFNPADPSPGPGGLEGPRNEVLRFDLHTGNSTPWFYRPGASLYVAGMDHSNNLFVTAALATPQNGTPDSEVWRVESATAATRLYAGTSTQSPWRLSAIDSHGAWFDAQYASASTSAVWLYEGGSLHLVATLSVGDLGVAGGCIP